MNTCLNSIMFASKLNDIPCFIRIDSYTPGYPAKLSGPMEEAEEGCPDEIEYTILDHRKIIAPWLKKQITDADDERFIEEFYVTLLEIKHGYED